MDAICVCKPSYSTAFHLYTNGACFIFNLHFSSGLFIYSSLHNIGPRWIFWLIMLWTICSAIPIFFQPLFVLSMIVSTTTMSSASNRTENAPARPAVIYSVICGNRVYIAFAYPSAFSFPPWLCNNYIPLWTFGNYISVIKLIVRKAFYMKTFCNIQKLYVHGCNNTNNWFGLHYTTSDI